MHDRTCWHRSIALVTVLWVAAGLGPAQEAAPPAFADPPQDTNDRATAPPPAADAPQHPDYRVDPDYWVEMPDGVLLATEVWLPTTTGPFPTVLVRTPYDCSDPPEWPLPLYVQEGYAVVCQETRGCGRSGGTWYYYVDDNADGHATIDWITQQAWSNGKVGMIGRSGLGATQYAIASGAPAALKCLAPAHDTPFRYELAWPGGALYYGLIYNWLNDMGFLNLYYELLEHRLCDGWSDPNWVDPPEEIHVPMLHMNRWYDYGRPGALGAFQLLQHQGGAGAAGNQYLYMDPLTHGHTYGQFPRPPSPIPFEEWRQQLELDWLDYWLKDEATGVDSWPAARIYVMGAVDEPGAPGNEWQEMQDWPPDAETRTLYLSQGDPPHGGGLDETLPPPGSAVLLIDPGDDPVPTWGGADPYSVSGPWDQAAYPVGRPIESRADVLTFTTGVLAGPVAVMGAVTARIWIDPDTPDLDLSVRLTDVYPDGKSVLITDGIQRARMRCGCDQECFMDLGTPYEIEVDMWSTSMIFNAGHRIRVDIAGTNWERFERNDNSGGDLNTPNYTVAYPLILFGPEHPTSIELPIPFILPFWDGFESGDTSRWNATVP